MSTMCKALQFCLILSLSASFLGCDRGGKLENIDFRNTVELKESDSPEMSEIDICVGSMITPAEGYAYYKKLLDYIGRKLDMKVNFIEKKTYGEVNALLKDGSIDVAFVCGGPYVKGNEEFELELLAAPVIGGNTVYYSYIIVERDSQISELEDLRGRMFAFVDPLSNTGKLIPTYMLYEIGEDPQSFFKECLFTYSHDSSIKAVAQGIVDGAAVDSLIWEYMNRKNDKYTKKTKIIRISKPYGIPPVVVRPGLNEELKARIKNILLVLHEEEEGRRIIDGMSIEKFVEVDDSIYNTIREVRARINK